MADEQLTPDRAARLLRAKAGELEAWVMSVWDNTDPTLVALAAQAADLALIATLLADVIERTA